LLFALSHALNPLTVRGCGRPARARGFLWALVDREDLFLHDRLAGTKIVRDDL